MIETRPARYRDALELAPRLRFEDAGEIGATWELGAREGLCLCLLQSDRSFALVESGVVIGLWGVGSADFGGLKLGRPWLLAAEPLFARRRDIVRHSRGWVERLLLDYDVLTNLTLASNTTHLRWLAWCGFRALRVHRHHGRAGVPYCEFYRVNPLRHEDDAGVRETLCGRPVADLAEVDPLTLRAACFAASGFPADDLQELLDRLQQRHRCGGRVRPAVAALLVEAAATVCRTGGRDPLLREWAENLLTLAETAHLDGIAAAQLVFALDAAPGSAGMLPQPVVAAARRAPHRGMSGVAALTRHFIATLTLSGRVGRIQGRRLRMAALGLTEDALRQPLGIPLAELVDVWVRLRPFAGAGLDGVRTPREAPATELRKAVADHLVGRVLADVLECWAREPMSGRPAGGAAMSVRATTALLADRVARRLLPAPRSGGVLAGYVDRQYLCWLVRGRLLTAVGEADGAVLAADIGALLVAGRAEARLLSGVGFQAPEDDLAAVIDAIEEVFGADSVRRGGDLEGLLAVLAPAFAAASVHGAQLGPALLTWSLLSDGTLDEALVQVSDVLDAGSADTRTGYRRLLRRLGRTVDGASLQRHLTGPERSRRGIAC